MSDEPRATGDQIVKTSERLFSEEVAIARTHGGEDVLDELVAEPAYEFNGGRRKFKQPGTGL